MLNPRPEPNLVGHAILVALLLITSPLLAEKILLSVYVVLFSFGVRYVLGAIRPDATFLSVLAFPFVYSYSLHLGFYNFSLSLALFFVVLGFWLRRRDRLSPGSIFSLSALLLLLSLSHILSTVMAWFAMVILVACFGLRDTRTHDGGFDAIKRLGRCLRAHAGAPLLASVPALGIIVAFLLRQHSLPDASVPLTEWWGERLARLVVLEGIISFQIEEVVFSLGLVLVFLTTATAALISKLRSRQEWHVWDGLLLVVVGYTLTYLLAPGELAGGSGIRQRLSLYVYFALLLWLAGQTYTRRVERSIRFAAIIIAAGFLWLHSMSYVRLNALYEEYLSAAEFVQRDSTLLPLSFDHRGRTADGGQISRRVQPFRHTAGYIAAERGVVVFDNYEADKGYFPVLFRPKVNPYTYIRWQEEPDRNFVNFLDYPAHTPGQIDYVLIWGNPRGTLERNPYVDYVYEQLEVGYRIVYHSPGRGLVELYRRNTSAVWDAEQLDSVSE